MANDTATLKFTLSYTEDGQTVSVPAKTVLCPFVGKSLATVDIPDGTAQDTELDVPVGSIGDGCSLLLLENDSGQDLKVNVNGGAAASHDLPDGGICVVVCADALSAARQVLTCTVETTAAQVGSGRVRVYAFGDPE
jgi:hypothetical protein